MPISSSSWGKALWEGVNEWYGKAYSEYPEECKQIFPTFTSRKQFEEDVGSTGFGLAAIKEEGAGVQYDTEEQGFVTRYTHVEYALGFIITRILYEDDLYDVAAQKRSRALAFSMRQTKETVAANVLNRAFNSSYTYGDGVELCSTANLNKSGGTWSNEMSTPAQLSESAIEQALIDLAGFTNDRGLKIAVRAKNLIIPKELEYEAHRILRSTDRPATADNDGNAVRQLARIPNTVVNHYLTNTKYWWIQTDVMDGLKHFERRADEFTMDNDFDTENAKYKATARYSFGCTDKRGIYGVAAA